MPAPLTGPAVTSGHKSLLLVSRRFRIWRTPRDFVRMALMQRPLAWPALLAALLCACGTSARDGAAVAFTDAGGTVTPGSSNAGVPGDDAGAPADATASPAPVASPPVSDAGATSAPSPQCTGTYAWTPGESQTISIDLGDGGVRSYDVYVGTSVQVGKAVPLLVNMHGLTNTPEIQALFSQMNPVADANGFVVVYPDGLGASFNAGGCCGLASSADVDDVGFVRAIVADAESKICIDSKRVYETGFSNGGMMSYRLACDAADLFAAVAPTEGENETTTCTPSRPVPLAAFQYLGDPIVPATSAQQSVEMWANRLDCTDSSPAQATNAGFACEEWSQCGGGSQVWYCTMPGGTHYPPIGSAPVVWSFLSQFSLP